MDPVLSYMKIILGVIFILAILPNRSALLSVALGLFQWKKNKLREAISKALMEKKTNSSTVVAPSLSIKINAILLEKVPKGKQQEGEADMKALLSGKM